jgi:hypothetical protein
VTGEGGGGVSMRGSLGVEWPQLLPPRGGMRLAVVVGAHDGATEAARRELEHEG